MHTRELGLTREGVRDGFARAVGTYDGLTKGDVYQLAHMVGVELCRRNRRIEGGRAKGMPMVPDAVYIDTEGDVMVGACILVNCQDAEHGTFELRDGVRFDRDCRLEIAEWADERDAMPFILALDAWVDEVKDELYWRRTHAGKGGGRDE